MLVKVLRDQEQERLLKYLKPNAKLFKAEEERQAAEDAEKKAAEDADKS
jgi:hypothetical protein